MYLNKTDIILTKRIVLLELMNNTVEKKNSYLILGKSIPKRVQEFKRNRENTLYNCGG